MTDAPHGDIREAQRRLAEFLADTTGQRLFRHPTVHPCNPTGFCYCDRSLAAKVWTYLKGVVLTVVLALPFNRLKIWLLRRMGAIIGQNVFISVGVQVDPLYPQLLTIEDDVFVGMNARIFLHEFRIDEFIAGRVVLRRGAFIGWSSAIGCGVEVGEGAVVAAAAVVARDVPAGMAAIGNPARIVKRRDASAGRESDDG